MRPPESDPVPRLERLSDVASARLRAPQRQARRPYWLERSWKRLLEPEAIRLELSSVERQASEALDSRRHSHHGARRTRRTAPRRSRPRGCEGRSSYPSRSWSWSWQDAIKWRDGIIQQRFSLPIHLRLPDK